MRIFRGELWKEYWKEKKSDTKAQPPALFLKTTSQSQRFSTMQRPINHHSMSNTICQQSVKPWNYQLWQQSIPSFSPLLYVDLLLLVVKPFQSAPPQESIWPLKWLLADILLLKCLLNTSVYNLHITLVKTDSRMDWLVKVSVWTFYWSPKLQVGYLTLCWFYPMRRVHLFDSRGKTIMSSTA